MTTLYRIDANKKIRVWSIEQCDDHTILITFGTKGGASQEKFEEVEVNQSGRDIYDQVELRINSRINSKIDQGYCRSEMEAIESWKTNALKLPKPMLAKPIKDCKVPLGAMTAQHKYDGNRCLIHNDGDQLIAYTRNGKVITTIGHILKDIEIPYGTTLDGELYCHGMVLQEIVSRIKRKQPETEKIQYVVYDHISQDKFSLRLQQLYKFKISGSSEIAPTRAIEERNIMAEFAHSRAAGYEGLILRTDDCGYEAGKRSKSLIKVKATEDGWFDILDILPSADGWARLKCQIGDKSFIVSAPGMMDERIEIYNNRYNYIGKKVRVEYANLTKDGIPFHPVAVLIE